MPVPSLKKLSPQSDDAQAKASLSECIAQEMDNGHPQDQAVAMCIAQVEKATGRSMPMAGTKNPPPGQVGA